MGLGKTMQAITAIRLLLRCGEIRTVLLVCPKPLVTNWQREFAHWAPEIPLLAIEGDQAKRAWQWQLPDVPCGSPTTSWSAATANPANDGRSTAPACTSTWWCSTNRSGSRTARAPPPKWCARSRGGGAGP